MLSGLEPTAAGPRKKNGGGRMYRKGCVAGEGRTSKGRACILSGVQDQEWKDAGQARQEEGTMFQCNPRLKTKA